MTSSILPAVDVSSDFFVSPWHQYLACSVSPVRKAGTKPLPLTSGVWKFLGRELSRSVPAGAPIVCPASGRGPDPSIASLACYNEAGTLGMWESILHCTPTPPAVTSSAPPMSPLKHSHPILSPHSRTPPHLKQHPPTYVSHPLVCLITSQLDAPKLSWLHFFFLKDMVPIAGR